MAQILEQPDIVRSETRRGVHPRELASDAVRGFVHRAVRLCRPDRIYWCNGSAYEWQRLTEQAARQGAVEQCKLDPGATTTIPVEAPCGQLESPFKDCMKGRTMYVVPFMTEPIGASPGDVGIQITDSLAVVLNIANETRIGDEAQRALGSSDNFSRGLHSAGNGNLQYACARNRA